MSISTGRGDDGTTGLLHGGRVGKDSRRIETNGAIDEAQAVLGLARAEVRGQALDAELAGLERGLVIVMAEVATAPRNRGKLVAGESLVTEEMVDAIGGRIQEIESGRAMPAEFILPGQDRLSATLDLARTVVRRAERNAVGAGLGPDSRVVPYLNRLSDLCWLLARSCEAEPLAARTRRVQAP
ncbi:MAG: cob(I)yrinic acid a,c-diamide adenosyltransferase [Acidimicrobiales bacterium]